MRFYLDEDLPDRVAAMLRELGLDAVPTRECGRDGRADDDQLQFAAEEGRTIVTQNRADFDALTAQFVAEGRSHAGVLLLPSSLSTSDYTGLATVIARYDHEHPDGMPPSMVDYLVSGRR